MEHVVKKQDISRRGALLAVAGAVGLSLWWLNAPAGGGNIISAEAAFRAQSMGDMTIVDIRTPDEWAQSGSPRDAWQIDMQRPDFLAAFYKALNEDRSTPVAIICATGVRSKRLTMLLEQAGFTQVFDVSEGMFGSSAGAGWLASKLPVDRS